MTTIRTILDHLFVNVGIVIADLDNYAGGKTSKSGEKMRASRRSVVPFRLGGLFRTSRLLTSVIIQIPLSQFQTFTIYQDVRRQFESTGSMVDGMVDIIAHDQGVILTHNLGYVL